jgi:hypothetical protein
VLDHAPRFSGSFSNCSAASCYPTAALHQTTRQERQEGPGSGETTGEKLQWSHVNVFGWRSDDPISLELALAEFTDWSSD